MLLFILADGAHFSELTSLGAAGIMGAMWLWERTTSRKREQQLDNAHERILSDRIQLDQLMVVMRHNADVLSRLTTTQDQLVRHLEAQRRAPPDA